MKVCDDMKNTRFKLSEEKKQELHERNREVTRNNMRIALKTVETYFKEVVNSTNDPSLYEHRIISNKKSFLTDPLYMQNIITYISTMLFDTLLDDLEIKLLLHCRVTAVDISYNPHDKDLLMITFEYPNNNEIESYRIAVPCCVKDEYIYF